MRNIRNFISLILFSLPVFVTAQIDRSKAPEPGPAPAIKIGDYQSFVLNNGLKVFVIENHKIPRVAYSLILDFDPILEGENAGYISITGDLLGTGTKTRTKAEIDEAIDFIGADFSTSPSSIYAACLKKHNDKLLDVFADVVLNSQFNQTELEKLKTQALSGLAYGKNDPGVISRRVRGVVLYGKDHPYGELETEKSIESVNLDMCTKFYNTYFKPNIAYLAIVGDITVDEAKPLIQKYFGEWEKGTVQPAKIEIPKAPSKPTVIIVDRPNAVQSSVSVTYPIVLKVGSPESLKAGVMNTILGGGVYRLFMNLRETHGYTYGAYSQIRADEYIGSFGAFADVRNEVTDSAINEILYEMNRIVNEPVSQEELTRVINNKTGDFALSLEDPRTISRFALNIELYKLPKDYYANYLKNLAQVSIKDVQEAAKAYIKPGNCYIVVVGKAEEIAEKLKKFSPDGIIHYYDEDGNEYDPNAKIKAAPEGIDAKTVLESYIKAVGGKEKIKAIKDVVIEADMKMQGMSLGLKEYKKQPDKYAVEISMSGNLVQKVVMNGDIAKSSGMQGEQDIEGEQLEELKGQDDFCEELNYLNEEYKLQLLGTEDVNDEAAYVVEIITPAGKAITSYFSTESGFKLKQTMTVVTPMGTMDQVAFFDEYKEFGDFFVTTKAHQTVGPNNIEIELKSIKFNEGIDDKVFEIE
ncbi:MAG: insulinase family protein [Bacteroidales bacterium]|nr:insulinase family protein [Bacteroidales bacterium]